MESLRLLLAMILGLTLGMWLHRPTEAKAQADVKVTITGGRMIGYTLGNGSQIVGFSCVSNDGSPECYVASIK